MRRYELLAIVVAYYFLLWLIALIRVKRRRAKKSESPSK